MVQPILGPRPSVRSLRVSALNDAELVGGILYGAEDPDAAARALLEVLEGHPADRETLRLHQLDPRLVEVARRAFAGRPKDELSRACAAGAAWVSGRRSVHPEPSWQPVLSIEAGSSLPPGTERGTAETLTGLIAAASRRVRIATPFLDRGGAEVLRGVLRAALERGVDVELTVRQTQRATDALKVLAPEVATRGTMTVRFADAEAAWPHLKLVTVDGRSAYVGSANVTEAALAGRNVELGVLIRGERVAAFDAVLDRLAIVAPASADRDEP